MLQRYVHENLFIEDGKKNLHLRGSKCGNCGRIQFPVNDRCPYCRATDMEDVALSDKGKLYSFTTTYMPVSRFEPPHTIGMVELQENIRFLAPLIGNQNDFHVGMDVCLQADTYWSDSEEAEPIIYIGHWFQTHK